MKKIILVFMLLLIACQSSTAPEDTPENTYTVEDYFPLAIGNAWVYPRYLDQRTVFFVLDINSSYTWEGKTVYDGYMSVYSGGYPELTKFDQSKTSIRQIEDHFQHYYIYDDGSIKKWTAHKPSDSTTGQRLIKEPLEVGNEWGRSSDDDEERLKITEVGISKSVEAGNFNDCIKVELVGSDKYWIYAPNVGLIETEYGELREELRDYKVE